MEKVPELFGSSVFTESAMRESLPKDVYKAVKHTMLTGDSLPGSVANIVANAMKDWALERGATHYTHWFQPMTGVTAEKHESFISPTGEGRIIMEFSGKELIKGESDASSFPSGGLRNTFEARGYTAWDPTSYAFVKDDTLYIPTVFYSYSGEALDKKTPLLRSMAAINTQSLRVLHLLGRSDVSHVTTTVGAEQEYFLVDKKFYDKRKDLSYTGRTLFGAKPPKGQELEDQYYGNIKPRIKEFMRELDVELWKLGILAKTEHNEAAPAQHELAPIYASTNVANDHNQLTMELMKRVALKHGLVCLLHEKPFDGVNGSGKHNNWSLTTDAGENILDPGKSPSENTVFLVFIAAVIKAVDEHQDLLRISVANAGNDYRLGANEAPPAIVSMFLGTELEEVLEAILQGRNYQAHSVGLLDTSVAALPDLYRDTSDRNRTSPFAFTGNKFEFRMLGSSISIAEPNIVLNTIVADSLAWIADKLESGNTPQDVISNILHSSGRIIFNGNNYDRKWVAEAEKRGLLNLSSTASALPHYCDEKNVELFERHKVLSRVELTSRTEIELENYCKIVGIEARTALSMLRNEILPAVSKFSGVLSASAINKKNLLPDISCEYEIKTLSRLSELTDSVMLAASQLEKSLQGEMNFTESAPRALYYHDVVSPFMKNIRVYADEMETLVGTEYWPFPTYDQLLFGI